MDTTCNWLKDYCDTGLSPEELAERLSMAGVLVEQMERRGDGDVYLNVEITSNRPDLLGAIGIARDLSALTGRPLALPPVEFECGPERVEAVASVEVQAPDLCPRYTARVVRGVKVGPSPDWLRNRLEAIGLRPVNNVVDVTNYVLFECGQPLHAFDLAKLKDGKVIVRRALEGETMTSIDGTECRLTPEMLVIADAQRAVAVAGVMGGLETEIGEQTTDVLLESAEFEKSSNRRTSRALQLSSDSSYRFERGVDPVQVEWASRRAARLIREVAGGTICEGVLDTWTEPYEPAKVTLRFARLNRLLGLDVPPDTAVHILARLGFETDECSNEQITVLVPPFRAQDVTREVDLIEEVIRIYGYDRVPERTTLPIHVGSVSLGERAEARAREMLVGLGYYEVFTNSFCTEATAKLVSPWTDAEPLEVRNTIRRDENRLRLSILPELLRVKRTNAARGNERSPLFEISRVYLPRPDAGPKGDSARPVEKLVLSVLCEDDLLTLKGVIETLVCRLGVAADSRVEPLKNPFFRDGRAAEILLDGERFAVLGEASKETADRFDLVRAPCLAELDFNALVKRADFDPTYSTLPAFPGSVRDLAVVVDEAVTWAEIERTIRELDLSHLEEIVFFDVFRGRQVPPGKKSVAFSLLFRAADRTLTRDEVEESRRRAIDALKSLGAELRG